MEHECQKVLDVEGWRDQEAGACHKACTQRKVQDHEGLK